MTKKKIDQLDLRIIDLLNEEPRRSVKGMAEKLHVTRLTVDRRLDKLVKKGLIAINVGLNLKQMGFRTAYIGFEVKGREKRKQAIDLLTKCPRVLTILQPEEEANMMVYCYGETNNTLESFIQSMRDNFMDRVVYVHYSEPPIYPDKICIKAFPEKQDAAPCGMMCHECEEYMQERCLGCPAVKVYRGII
jgi:DNA-binding Lrp family transcriptional regulator